MKMRLHLRMALVILALIASSMVVSLAAAGGGEPVIKQVQVKAVYLYNFLHFVTWPNYQEEKEKKVVKVIGVLGDQELGRSLTELARRLRQRGRTTIKVILYSSYRPDLDFSACHILFIGRSQADNFKMIVARLKGRPILTVADARHFLSAGGMIELVEMEGRIRYQVNLSAARTAGLRLSSQLLESALKVIRPMPKED
ncbi:hypothetical protein MNBD_DELTA03-1823 [hydrothermal vent metagenome]|uniref:Transmembrane protein n=1 Tax=hydrothermal vent metagenome TaxID=652676 RepID=A0A3B0USA3_9ZZZZ